MRPVASEETAVAPALAGTPKALAPSAAETRPAADSNGHGERPPVVLVADGERASTSAHSELPPRAFPRAPA